MAIPNQSIPAPHPSKSLVEKGYNLIAPAYLTWSNTIPSPRDAYIHKLLALLPSNAKVLELGCGAGVPGTQLLASQCQVIANDISSSQIALAKIHVPNSKLNVQFLLGDMMNLSFEPGEFDAVVAFYSILHLPREEQRVLMGRIAGWLKEGGYFLGNFGIGNEEETRGDNFLGSEMFWSSWDVKGNQEMVESADLGILEGKVIEQEEEGSMVGFWWVLGRKIEGEAAALARVA